ncbi:MAG: SAM-dependent methyltransferase [Syntrophales bacterium]|nr:SAM-dependent methyltransferase [Syntrophales bacterium]
MQNESNGRPMSVEYMPSETAMGAVTLRAMATLDEREEIKGPDSLAEIFLSEERRCHLKDPMSRKGIITNRIYPGMYEFMIARTAFFDRIVEQALNEDIPQIAFLGAGYDSRPYRFRDIIKNTRIFELDIEPTQLQKKKLLRQANITIPDQLAFVSINFKTDNIGEVLHRAGFDRNQKTLFVWEGVTYYLSPEVVDDVLRVISSNAPAGSLICFDYAAVSPEESCADGVMNLREFMKTRYANERTQFGIRNGEIESFLSTRGYRGVEHLNAVEMARKYLKLHDGTLAGEIPALFCLVLASISGDNR